MPTATRPPQLIPDDDMKLLKLIAQGLPLDAVGKRLHISERTVRRRIRALCDRLGVSTVIEAAVWAARRRLL